MQGNYTGDELNNRFDELLSLYQILYQKDWSYVITRGQGYLGF